MGTLGVLLLAGGAGVTLTGDLGAMIPEPIVLGIFIGLVVGKQFGITVATWLIVRAGLATLPSGIGWRHIYGAAWLGGIGFTMSLFIADLAYAEPENMALAKIAILAGSLVAGVAGFVILRTTRRTSPVRHSGDSTATAPDARLIGLDPRSGD